MLSVLRNAHNVPRNTRRTEIRLYLPRLKIHTVLRQRVGNSRPPAPPCRSRYDDPHVTNDRARTPDKRLKSSTAGQVKGVGKMAQPTNVLTTPNDLPVPQDDGACSHLKGIKFPPVSLSSTAGNSVDPSSLSGLSILFCYPRTGAPGEVITDEWNSIPGARGCTPHACGFRDASDELLEYGVSHVFGISTQDTPYQQELKQRVKLPYQLLSDEHLELITALKLPTMEWQGRTLIKRLALAVEDGTIVQVWYPVFPSDKNAEEVLKWLKSRTGRENLSTQQENEMLRNMQRKC